VAIPDISLIYDRTQSDVDRAVALAVKGWAKLSDDERAEWLAELRGHYNYTDLNRVENAVLLLRDLLREYGNTVKIKDTAIKTDWIMADFVRTAAQITRYLGNVEIIRQFAPAAAAVSLPGTLRRITYADANNIERCLQITYDAIRRAASSLWVCGETVCG